MPPRIESLTEKLLVGKRLEMSLAENRTSVLWRGFMPRRKEILNAVGAHLYSVEIYPRGLFDDFAPEKEFEKWAAVEVADFENVPDEMKTLTIPSGLYAVFLYRGRSNEAAGFYRYIFAEWLPDSEFLLDERPHFALMGEKYKNDSADSEEELWIPVKAKENGKS